MTSAVVRAIRPNSRTAAAAPSTRSSQTPVSERCDATAVRPSLAGGYTLDLLAELGKHLGAVDALGAGGLHPLLLDDLGPFLYALDQLGRGFGDLDADPFHLLESRAVGGIPGFAGEPSQLLARNGRDDILVGLRELALLVLVHEEAERGAVEAARKECGVLDDRAELDGVDRLEREEGAVGDAGAQELVGLGRRLDEGRGAEGARHLLGDAAAGADLHAGEVLDLGDGPLGIEHLPRSVGEDAEQLYALVLADRLQVLPMDAR